MDMDISMDIHAKSVDMDMDMDVKFHIHGKPANFDLRSISHRCEKPPYSRKEILQIWYPLNLVAKLNDGKIEIFS